MAAPMISLEDLSFSYRMRSGFLTTSRFQALKEIDLDVRTGETLGIIGANGSGKSTLLRILARIYRPDGGRIRFFTQKISLLSLALGFDPQLTGRDNAVLSAMLLGATLEEARDDLDRIIEFSELGEFASQPVKTYSSGMRARLGFAVAIGMKTDVLLIDEALAVGDARFRAKSQKAITGRLESSQTVVLVSHSTAEVKRLCDRAVWMDHGRIMGIGHPVEITERYENAN